MPLKRRAPKSRTNTLSPTMLASAKRLIELDEMHLRAIRGLDDAFHSDGRHEELVNLIYPVHQALGIKPWEFDDADEIIRAAVAAAEKQLGPSG